MTEAYQESIRKAMAKCREAIEDPGTITELPMQSMAPAGLHKQAHQQELWSRSHTSLRHSEVAHGKIKEPREWAAAISSIGAAIALGDIVALIGPNAKGKTQMAHCLIKSLIDQGKESWYWTRRTFLMRVRSCFRADSRFTEEEMVKEFRKPHFLVIDQVTSRPCSEHESDVFDDVLDWRYADKKSTLLISTMTAPEFAVWAGPDIWSRIERAGGVIEARWEI